MEWIKDTLFMGALVSIALYGMFVVPTFKLAL